MFLKYHYSTIKPVVSRAIRVSLDTEQESCGVIPLYWISREYYDGRRKTNRLVNDGEGTGSETPPWSKFVGWILDVQTAPSGEVTYDGFRVVQAMDGDSFLYIDRGQRQVTSSLEELLSELEAAVGSSSFGAFAGREYDQARSFRVRVFGYF
jgi:hypothetical protein